MQQSSWPRNILIMLVIIQLAPATYRLLKNSIESVTKPKTRVGIVSIRGVLQDTSSYISQAKEFFEDPTIKAVVLSIDSPGGAPGGTQAFWHSVRELKHTHEKPVIAWVQNIAASGGYYVACAADHIIATPSALIGSIGVYMQQWRVNELINKYDIYYKTIHAGKYKTTNNPFLPPSSPEQTMMLTEMVTDIYNQFAQDVETSRPMITQQQRHIWAEGKVFTGQQALQHGLIDEVGSQITVEHTVKRLANITTDIEWVRPARLNGLARLFMGDEESPSYITQLGNSFAEALWSQFTQEKMEVKL